MSIPPLVCSTPPPPDQCEEDRDPEDFDLHYSLSQEDEDDDNNDYKYGNFSRLEHFKTQLTYHDEGNLEILTEQNQTTLNNDIKLIPQSETLQLQTPVPMVNRNEEYETTVIETIRNSENETMSENSLKCEEDNNIEDLDLILEECTEALNKKIVEENDIKEYDINVNVKKVNVSISDIGCIVDEPQISINAFDKQNEIEATSNQGDKTEPIEEEFVEIQSSVTGANINEQEYFLDSEFDALQHIKFNSPEIKCNIINDTCDNPWKNKVDKDDDDEFSNFTANFNQVEPNNTDNNITETPINVTSHKYKEIYHTVSQNINEDDDFGDFDGFKSSNAANVINLNTPGEQTCTSHQVPVFNLELSGKVNQILDSVNQVLNTIFVDEIVEPDGEFECKLESLLNETWSHLMETDVRQPYIVNWNNSLGQKILLRALCIDSRNILFGAKWCHHMPKYAVALSAAPLQPQKPGSQFSMSQNENTCTESAQNKVGTWSDPFTSNGQESCNTGNEVSGIERNSVHMEVFDTSISTKSKNMYPSNLSVQPLRQISLPDTHIFTPTDSETPRSKTIHYDIRPQDLIPKSSSNSHTFHSENSVLGSEKNAIQHKVENNDYWEFQDFKSTPNINSAVPSTSSEVTQVLPDITSTGDNQHNLNKTYQCELLQPVKIDPIVPTLNWPNPGEVKEVFDDFTDFVSCSSWNKEIGMMQIPNNGLTTECSTIYNTDDKAKNTQTNETKTIQSSLSDGLDDDFDTFQYVLPVENNMHEPVNKVNVIKNTDVQGLSSKFLAANQKSNLEQALSTLNCASVPSANRTRQVQPFSKDIQNLSSTTEASSVKHTPQFTTVSQCNILQPVPINSNTQQRTGQILQPLSLESYSQLNWPSPGIDLQDLSKFNPVETLHSLKTDLSINNTNKTSSPLHTQKNSFPNQTGDDELWGEFISSKSRQQPSTQKSPNPGEDDEWTDFVSSPSVKPQNGLNTISFNVHTNSNMQKNLYQNKLAKNSQSLDMPTLNYITPKANNHTTCNKHFQNL